MPVLSDSTFTDGGQGGQGQFGPRRDWQFVLGPPSGGWVTPVSQATGRQVTWNLTDSHQAQFTVNATAGYDTGIAPLATDLHVLYGGVPVFRGRIGPSQDQLIAGIHLVTFTADSYRAILNRRQLYSTDPLTFTGDVSTDVVWGLMQATQLKSGGQLGIIKGIGFPFGGSRITKVCVAGDFIGPKIDDLAYIDPNGFDWDITPRDQVQQTLDIWPTSSGFDRGVILQYGDGLTGNSWSRSLDPSAYANASRETGGGTTIPVEITAANIATVAAGRFDGNYSCDEAGQDLLAARAALTLEAAEQFVPSWTIPLQPGAWNGPQHIWVGDTVHIVPGSGRFTGVTESMRVVSMTADIGQDAAAITLTCGQLRPDTREQLRHLAIELRQARKRQQRGKNPRPAYHFTGP
jgi:hypothetical protein